MRKLIAFSLLVFTAVYSSLALAEFEEGHEYRVLYGQPPVEKDAPLEVVEFFWWGCGHCYDFEPYLKKWQASKPDDVKLVKVPAALHEVSRFHAYVFYALELMGEAERLNDIIFDTIHKQDNKLSTQKAVEELLEKHGVDINTFRKAMKAWHVDSRVKRAAALFDKAQVRGVPSIMVNERYTSGDVKTYQDLSDVIDHMIELVRQEQQEQ